VDGLREKIKVNIGYDVLITQFECEDIDGLVELILETLCRPGKTIRISGAEFPTALVKVVSERLVNSRLNTSWNVCGKTPLRSTTSKRIF
jgi:hypothetical protein